MSYSGYFIFTTLSKEEILRRKAAGCLSNSYYKIEFKEPDSSAIYGNAYNYSLVDSVNACVEYLVDLPELERKLAVYGILPVKRLSFGEIRGLEAHENNTSLRKSAMHFLNEEEESVFALHLAVVFQKQKQ